MSHPCPKPRCPILVKDAQFACHRHWFEISAPLRRRIGRSWRNGDLDEHDRAMAEAIEELSDG